MKLMIPVVNCPYYKNCLATRALVIVLFFILSLTTPIAFAQNTSSSTSGANTSYFDLGIKTGSFLPYDIDGVTELLPFWGLRFGHTISETLGFEYDLDFANAKGTSYYLGYFSLRHDFVVGRVLPTFLLLGIDGHYFRKPDTQDPFSGVITASPWRFMGGWHAGIGTETVIYGDLWFRADVRMGFSPGRQLSASLGGVYRF